MKTSEAISANEVVRSVDADDAVVGLSQACSRVARVLLEGGPMTATELAGTLHLTTAAVRRHLDTLMTRGYVNADEQAPFGPRRVAEQRGRGRPARFYTITPTGRDAFASDYGDVAVEALRYLRDRFGADAVADFARTRAQSMVARYAPALGESGIADRVDRLAEVLSQEGYAATADAGPLGLQLVQHHCPVAHVAEEFPEFCEAERAAFAELLGVNVTRLSTMASGGGVCTSVIPAQSLLDPPASHTAVTKTTYDTTSDTTTSVNAPTPTGTSERNPA